MATASVPNTFSALTKAKSAEVNANFTALLDFLNGSVVHTDASKAFTGIPSGPAVNPTTDNQFTRKKYVDDQVATKAASSHNHSAANITSGTLDSDRLPTIPDSKLEASVSRTEFVANRYTSTIDGDKANAIYRFRPGGGFGLFYADWTDGAGDDVSAMAVAMRGKECMRVWEDSGNDAGFAISDRIVGVTGTNAVLQGTTLDGEAFKILSFQSSTIADKDDVSDWALTGEQFDAIQPRTFVRKAHYVHGGHHYVEGDPAPEGAQLLRRGGFILEELMGVDLHLVTDGGIDETAVLAAAVAEIQSLRARVAALEAQ